MADTALGAGALGRAAAYPRGERDQAISKLMGLGLSIRQTQRLAGVGYGTIARVSRGRVA